MTGDGNRFSPKRYGLLKGQVQVSDDFDDPITSGEFGMSDTSDVDVGNPNESSSLSPDDRGQEGQQSLSHELLKIARRCAAMPVEDARPPDDIIGYDEHGLSLDPITPAEGAKPRE